MNAHERRIQLRSFMGLSCESVPLMYLVIGGGTFASARRGHQLDKLFFIRGTKSAVLDSVCLEIGEL